MTPLPLPHEQALLLLLDAAIRSGEEITAAHRLCDCAAVSLGPLTTLRELSETCALLAPYSPALPADADLPTTRAWLDASLLRMGLRPGAARFPARHSHTELPLTVVTALREDPDGELLLADICRTFDVPLADALAAALTDAEGWSPHDDTQSDGPCTCD